MIAVPSSGHPGDLLERKYKKRAIFSALFFLLFLLATFYQTAWSIVSIWIRSDTFAHGFLIIPIVLWMIWGRKDQFYAHLTKTELSAMALLGICGFIWFLAYLVDVLVIQQFALVAMMISGLWVILGTNTCKTIAFPLAYLIFLVPVGEGLVPWLMEFTATFTVALIKLSGIPVYREGLHFYLPSGSWSVVEACSGVRYLIASTTLGCLYAYLTYHSLLRRVLFIAVSIIVPIFANGVRAYIIVMLGHLSDMKIATGVDHLIYGWVFFGLVMFILFLIGNFWREEQSDDLKSEKNIVENEKQVERGASKQLIVSVVLTFGTIVIWPLLAWSIEHRNTAEIVALGMPQEIADWMQFDEPVPWAPTDGGAQEVSAYQFVNDDKSVQLFVHQYFQQSQGNELIPGHELLTSEERRWKIVGGGSQPVIVLGQVLNLRETNLKSGAGEELLVWQWYRVGDNHSANRYEVKIREVLEKLTFGRQDASRIYLSTAVSETKQGREKARSILSAFLTNTLTPIEQALDQSAGINE